MRGATSKLVLVAAAAAAAASNASGARLLQEDNTTTIVGLAEPTPLGVTSSTGSESANFSASSTIVEEELVDALETDTQGTGKRP